MPPGSLNRFRCFHRKRFSAVDQVLHLARRSVRTKQRRWPGRSFFLAALGKKPSAIGSEISRYPKCQEKRVMQHEN